MTIAHSKVTAQGQISVPAEVRRKMGVGPGSVLEWQEVDGLIVVSRAGRFSSEDVHRAVFRKGAPGRRSLDDLTEGIRRQVRKRHAGR